jgi:hypothetical protein
VPPHGTRPLLTHPEPNVDDSISITLNRSQVSHVLRQARGATGVAAALSGLTDNKKLGRAYDSIDDAPELSRSLLIGLLVLRCFPEDGSSVGIKEVADIVGTKSSNAYRYIATLVAAGLLERDPNTRRYHLPALQSENDDPGEKETV